MGLSSLVLLNWFHTHTMETLEHKTKYYYNNGKTRVPIDYQVKRITYGYQEKERHIIYYSNYQLIAESLKEVVTLLKEVIEVKNG